MTNISIFPRMLDSDDWQLRFYAPIPSLLSEEVIQSIWEFVHCLETIATQEGFEYSIKPDTENSNSDPSNLDPSNPENLNPPNLHSENSLEPWILEAIRQVSQTEKILHIKYSTQDDVWNIVNKSWVGVGEMDDRLILKILHEEIPINFWRDQALKDSPQGIYKIRSSPLHSYQAYSIIPLLDAYSCLLIVGLPVEKQGFNDFQSPFLNDQFTYLAAHFYKTALEFYHPQSGHIPWQSRMIESKILDSLKSRYGFVPKLLYDRRLQLFKTSLEETRIHFEPILDLYTMSIHGWEALARDPITGKAPNDLFDAAELWGLEFTVILDTTLLHKAIHRFENHLQVSKYRSKPLFVNVYPESLMTPEYFDQVKQMMNRQHKLLRSQHLTLEISEKKQLPFCFENPYHSISLNTFKARLMEYMSELGIQFGIDDFGVGYSSVHRFMALNLPYVKIDREILHQKPFDAVIRFVKEVIAFANPQTQAEIIVEGIDSASPMSLKQLKALGIRFVQGYLIGKATANLELNSSWDELDL